MKYGRNIRRSGNISIIIIVIMVIFIFMLLILFSICIIYINVYSIVYNYKMDLYNLNRSAIISVNKVEGKLGVYEYDKNKYINQFILLLKKTYNLDNNLSDGSRNIDKIEILEYEIYHLGDVDNVTNKVLKNDVVHVLTKITYKPIIFKNLFPDNCTYIVHNDISIKTYE